MQERRLIMFSSFLMTQEDHEAKDGHYSRSYKISQIVCLDRET